MVEEEFGSVDFDAKSGGTRVFPKRWKLKVPKGNESETTLILRILPPIKSLKDTNAYASFHTQHFGWNGINKENPDKPQYRPFGCVREMDYETKKTTVECEACKLYFDKKDLKEKLLARAKDTSDQDELSSISEQVDGLTEWLFNYNRDSKWFLNAMSVDGEFGTLTLTKTCYDDLRALFKKTAKEDGVHALKPSEGVWVKFTRSGYGRDVKDVPEVLTEVVQLPGGGKAKVIKPAPLTEAQLTQALKVCDDLANDPVRYLTPEQVKLIVQTNGDPEEVDKIWAMGSAREDKNKTQPKAKEKPTSDNPSENFFNQFNSES